MADHPTPTPMEEAELADDLIQRTIERELARQKLPRSSPGPEDFEGPEPDEEAPENPPPAPRRAIYLLPCLTAVFAAAFCVLLGVYLSQLRQDDARYAQLGETLSSIEAMSRNFDSMDREIAELERQLDSAQGSLDEMTNLWLEATTEASSLSALYHAELYLQNGDYYAAALMLTTRTVTDMTAFLEEHDAEYEGGNYVPLLPRYQAALDTLVEEGYLDLEVQEDGTELAILDLDLSEEMLDYFASSTYHEDDPAGEGG